MRDIPAYEDWKGAPLTEAAEKKRVDFVPNTALEELDWNRLRKWAKEQGEKRSQKDIESHLDRTYAVAESATPVNEATYVGKKHSMQLEEMRVLVGLMCDNVSESPDFESTRKESERAIEAITAAFTAFYTATKKAMEKIGTNYAGV